MVYYIILTTTIIIGTKPLRGYPANTVLFFLCIWDYRCLAGFIMVMFGVILIRYKVVGNVINGMVLALTQQIVVPDINRYKM